MNFSRLTPSSPGPAAVKLDAGPGELGVRRLSTTPLLYLDVLTLRIYTYPVKFEWDEKKNRANIKNHCFDFADAWEIVEGPMYVAPDLREEYGEDRWIGIGDFRGRVVVVVLTERGKDTIRIISVRKALKHERKYYEKKIEDEFGAN